MCSSYITPDICYGSLNSENELDVDMEVKSEPESEDGFFGISQNRKKVLDNQSMTRTHTRLKTQAEEVEDEPLIDLDTACLPQEVVEYEEFENKPALLLLVEKNHTSSPIKDLRNTSKNHSTGLLLNKQTYQNKGKESSNNTLTKTLRNVKRKCYGQETKQDSPNICDPTQHIAGSSRGSTANGSEQREKYYKNEGIWKGVLKNEQGNNTKEAVEPLKTNKRTKDGGKGLSKPSNKNSLENKQLKELESLSDSVQVTVETPTNVESFGDKRSVSSVVSNDNSRNNIVSSESAVVTKVDNFVCTVCSKRFKQKSHLATHARAHINIRNFKCNECGSMFKTKTNLYFHLKTHEEAPFVCEKCNKIFPERKMLVRHIRVVHRYEGDFKCDQCGRQFKSSQKLELHYSIHTGKKPFSCDVCGRSFVYKSTHTAHMKGHQADAEFRCDVCPSGVRRRCQHFSDTRPWLCTVCGKSYPLKSTLKNHMKAHEPEKPFKCNECGKSFMKKYTYECHMKMHSGEQPQYMCDQCSQSYFNYFALKRHYLKHTGERNFVCDVCKKAFWTKDALKVHKRSHESVKMFECTQCSKAFAHKHTLVAHMKHHSAESESHSCALCLKTFVHKYNMSRHKCQSLINPHPLPPSFVMIPPPKHIDYSTFHIL